MWYLKTSGWELRCHILHSCYVIFATVLLISTCTWCSIWVISVSLSLSCRVERQHVRWDAVAARPPLLNPHGQHLHPVHHLHRSGTHLYGRKGRLPLWDSLPGWGRLAESALQKNQPLQKLAVLPHSLRAPVLLFWRWYRQDISMWNEWLLWYRWILTLTFCCPVAPQIQLCRLLLTTPATLYSHAQRKVYCRYDFVSINSINFSAGCCQWPPWINYVAFSGVWSGCWWPRDESCGNHVTELHRRSCWKHSQVRPDLMNCKFFFHCSLVLIIFSTFFETRVPLQDNRSFCLQTHRSDLSDWQIWVLRLSPPRCHSCW